MQQQLAAVRSITDARDGAWEPMVLVAPLGSEASGPTNRSLSGLGHSDRKRRFGSGLGAALDLAVEVARPLQRNVKRAGGRLCYRRATPSLGTRTKMVGGWTLAFSPTKSPALSRALGRKSSSLGERAPPADRDR